MGVVAAVCGKNPERERQKRRFSKKVSVPLSSPLPAAKTPRLEGAALHLLPAARHRRSRPHPSARVPLGSSRCSLVCVRTRRVHASEGDRGLAPQQRSRSCTASANQLQLQCTAKTPLPGPPDPCVTPRSHGPFRRTALGRRGVPAASCAMHCTPPVQDLQGHAHRTCTAAPTRSERMRCSHEGIDAQPAHGQVSVAQGLRCGG